MSSRDEAKMKEEMKYNLDTERAVEEWICGVLSNPKLFKKDETLMKQLKSGIILCDVINKLRPGAIKRINRNPSAPYHQFANISNYLNGCKTLGLRSEDCFVVGDLYEENSPSLVLSNIERLANNAFSRGFTKVQIRDTSKSKTILSEVLINKEFDDDDDDDDSESKGGAKTYKPPTDPYLVELLEWANSNIKKKYPMEELRDLSEDARSGVKLIKLAEVVLQEPFQGRYYSEVRFVKDSVYNAITLMNFISQRRPVMCCSAQDIVRGNEAKIAALIGFLREEFDLDYMFLKMVNETQCDDEESVPLSELDLVELSKMGLIDSSSIKPSKEKEDSEEVEVIAEEEEEEGMEEKPVEAQKSSEEEKTESENEMYVEKKAKQEEKQEVAVDDVEKHIKTVETPEEKEEGKVEEKIVETEKSKEEEKEQEASSEKSPSVSQEQETQVAEVVGEQEEEEEETEQPIPKKIEEEKKKKKKEEEIVTEEKEKSDEIKKKSERRHKKHRHEDGGEESGEPQGTPRPDDEKVEEMGRSQETSRGGQAEEGEGEEQLVVKEKKEKKKKHRKKHEHEEMPRDDEERIQAQETSREIQTEKEEEEQQQQEVETTTISVPKEGEEEEEEEEEEKKRKKKKRKHRHRSEEQQSQQQDSEEIQKEAMEQEQQQQQQLLLQQQQQQEAEGAGEGEKKKKKKRKKREESSADPGTPTTTHLIVSEPQAVDEPESVKKHKKKSKSKRDLTPTMTPVPDPDTPETEEKKKRKKRKATGSDEEQQQQQQQQQELQQEQQQQEEHSLVVGSDRKEKKKKKDRKQKRETVSPDVRGCEEACDSPAIFKPTPEKYELSPLPSLPEQPNKQAEDEKEKEKEKEEEVKQETPEKAFKTPVVVSTVETRLSRGSVGETTPGYEPTIREEEKKRRFWPRKMSLSEENFAQVSPRSTPSPTAPQTGDSIVRSKSPSESGQLKKRFINRFKSYRSKDTFEIVRNNTPKESEVMFKRVDEPSPHPPHSPTSPLLTTPLQREQNIIPEEEEEEKEKKSAMPSTAEGPKEASTTPATTGSTSTGNNNNNNSNSNNNNNSNENENEGNNDGGNDTKAESSGEVDESKKPKTLFQVAAASSSAVIMATSVNLSRSMKNSGNGGNGNGDSLSNSSNSSNSTPTGNNGGVCSNSSNREIRRIQKKSSSYLLTSNSISQEKIMRIAKAQAAMRKRVADEIMSTEETYLTNISTLYLSVPKIMQNYMASESEPITEHDLYCVFGNLEGIIDVSKRLYIEIKERLSKWNDESTTIGDLFKSYIEPLRVYGPYLQIYGSSGVTLHFLVKRNAHLRELVTKFEAEQHKTSMLDIQSFLIMPVQRLPRYSLLLRDFLKYTPKTHPDHSLVSEAFRMMEDLISTLNRGIDLNKNMALKKLIDVVDSIDGDLDSLVSESTTGDPLALVHEGPVKKITRDAQKKKQQFKKTYLFVFDKYILLCAQISKSEKQFTLIDIVKMEDIRASSIQKDDMTIISGDGEANVTYVIDFKNPTECLNVQSLVLPLWQKQANDVQN